MSQTRGTPYMDMNGRSKGTNTIINRMPTI